METAVLHLNATAGLERHEQKAHMAGTGGSGSHGATAMRARPVKPLRRRAP